MQTKDGHAAKSMVGSEATALFEFYILPYVQARMMPWIDPDCPRLEPGSENWVAWRGVCNEHARHMGLPKSLWLQVMVPLQFSVDNASTHKQLRMNMLRPRVPIIDEYLELEAEGRELLSEKAPELLEFPTARQMSENTRQFIEQLAPEDREKLSVREKFSVRLITVAKSMHAKARRGSIVTGIGNWASKSVQQCRVRLKVLDRLLGPDFVPGVYNPGGRDQAEALEKKLGFLPDSEERCAFLLTDLKFGTRMILNSADELVVAKDLVEKVCPPVLFPLVLSLGAHSFNTRE